MPYYGGSAGDPSQIIDADGNTSVQVEKTADDNTIRFNLGNNSGPSIVDAATFSILNGFYLNTNQDDLDFKVSGDSQEYGIWYDAGNNNGYVYANEPIVSGGADINIKWLVGREDNDLSINMGSVSYSDTAGRGGVFFGARARGTEASPSAVQVDDALFQFSGVGYSTEMRRAADILIEADDSPAGNSVPGRMVFQTTATGANSPDEKVRIGKDGVTVNQQQGDYDFRIASKNESHTFYMNASQDAIAMLTDVTTFDVNGANVVPTFTMKRKDNGNATNQVLWSDSDTLASRSAFNTFARSRNGGAVQNGDRLGVFQCYAHDGTNYQIGGVFQWVCSGAVSTGIVPTEMQLRHMDATGTLYTNIIFQNNGRIAYKGLGSANKITFYAEGGLRGNQQSSSSALGDLIWYTTNYSNGLRVDVSADQVNVANDSNQQGGLLSADIGAKEVRINKFNTDENLVVESSSAGVSLLETDTTNDKITLGTTIFTSRHQGKKGADVASGGTVTLGTDGNYFDITGTTAIDYITTTDWQAGSIVVLQFDGSVTVNHNTGTVPTNTAPILLSGSVNFAATANDTLMLAYDGANWREVSRTII